MNRPVNTLYRPTWITCISRTTTLLVCAALGATATLDGCTVGPDFKPPEIETPAEWRAPATDVSSVTYGGAVDTVWWTRFNDPELDSLVDRLARQNLDVAAAAERVTQAIAQRQVARSQGLPRIDGHASYQHQRVSPAGVTSLEVPVPGAPLEYNLYQDGLSASWELDLFGRVRRSVEAADANLGATVEARHGIALSAMAELARDYMQLRGAQTDEAITRRNLDLATQNIALVQSRIDNGVATTLDMAQSQAQRATIASNLPSLRATQDQLINAIGLLLAAPPRALADELNRPADQPATPPRVPVGLPGTVARQRPDVREAEARLHIATAETGVAVASFYPDVTLTGNFNLEGLQFGNAFSLADRAFSVGPSIDLPIFQGGRLRGTLHLRESQQREAAIRFHKTVLQAWQEVDDALSSYTEVQHTRGELVEAAHQNRIALDAARQRYVQGAADFLNVLTAESALLQSERALADNTTQQEMSLVTLYLAMGGGWETVDANDAATPSNERQKG